MKVVVASRFAWEAGHPPAEIADVDFAYVPEGRAFDGVGDADAAYIGPDPDRLRSLLAATPRLRWIHTPAAGVDRLLIPELVERKDITLTNNSGSYDASIAEFVIAMLFAAAKRVPWHVRRQERHEWAGGERGERHAELRGATVVVLGLGSIGGEVGRLAAAIGMRVVGVRRRAKPVSGVERVVPLAELAAVAREADFLVVAAPLTAETRGVVSREVIAALPPHAWVVNIARGEIVDEAALFEAVRDRRVGGAAIDAWWEEPLPKDSPWWDLENVIATPHHSWSSPRLRERSAALFSENIRRFRAGEPLLNVVDKRVGY